MPNMDEAGMELATRALAFLIQTSKSYAAELVEKCLDQCLEWLEKCYAEALNTLKINELSKDDRTHSMLLVLNELVRIADATFERIRLEALDIHQTETSIATPIEWLTQPRVANTVESSTARALVAANFSEICGHAKAAAFSCGRSVPVHQTLLELFPRLSAWDQCEPSLCKVMFEHAKNMKRTPEPAVFIFLTLFVKAYKTTVMNEIKQLLGLLFKTGLTK
ncbi:hypothetical protein ANCDUO_17487, partial [Ancylostoma duodenale]